MKKLIFLILILLVATGCGRIWKTGDTGNLGFTAGEYSQYFGYTLILSRAALDSACLSSNVPADLEKWIPAVYYDQETGSRITRKMYITGDTTLVVTPRDTLFEFTKRYGKR